MLTNEFVILLGWGVLMLGFWKRDYTITAISSMYLMIIGTWILTSKDMFVLPQLTKLGLGLVHVGIGFYVLVKSGTETYKGKKFKKPTWIKKKKEVENDEGRRE